jgi:hypothetical protein
MPAIPHSFSFPRLPRIQPDHGIRAIFHDNYRIFYNHIRNGEPIAHDAITIHAMRRYHEILVAPAFGLDVTDRGSGLVGRWIAGEDNDTTLAITPENAATTAARLQEIGAETRDGERVGDVKSHTSLEGMLGCDLWT